jgi:hypothetical protein
MMPAMGRGVRWLALMALLALLAAPLPVGAAGLAAGPRGGTTGLGAELGWGLGGGLRGRVALGAWDEERDVTASGVRYDGEIELRSVLAMLDWHPGGGGFRLTAGLAWNDNRVVGTAPLAEVFADEIADLARRGIDLRGVDLGLARGEAATDNFGPYVGLGWGRGPRGGGGLALTFDLGVFHHGRPSAELRPETSLPLDLVPGARQALDELIAREERQIEEEIDGYRFFPVVALGVSYRF